MKGISMNHYRFPENKLVKLCFPLFLLILQMVSRSTMYTSTFLGFGLSQAIMIGMILLTGILFLIYNRKNLKAVFLDRRMLLFVAVAVIILLPMLVKKDWQLMYFTILLYWFFAVFLTYFTSAEELGKYYVHIMTLVCFVNLLGMFVLKPMVHAGLITGNPFDSPGGWHMLHFGLTFVCDKNLHMVNALRAFGIFREPGLFQIFLFVAIQLNNYIVQWDKQWKMWVVDVILFFSMLTTFATGGVLALGLYIVFLFFDKDLYQNKKVRKLAAVTVIFGILMLVVAILHGGSWAYELIGMVEKFVYRSYSFDARVESVITDAEFFVSHPFFGADMQEVLYSVDNNTATSPILFAVLGILGGCLHVLSWAALAWKKERHWLMNLMLMVILFVPFNTQNVMGDMFFWLFPAMALAQQCLYRMDRILIKKKG